MINEIFDYLAISPVSGRPMAHQRDDDKYPFNDLSSTPVLVRQMTGPADRDISRRTFDLWIFTQANPSNSEVGALFDLGLNLERYIVANYKAHPIYYLDVVSGANGPYRDGQNRQAIGLSITASAVTGTPT